MKAHLERDEQTVLCGKPRTGIETLVGPGGAGVSFSSCPKCGIAKTLTVQGWTPATTYSTCSSCGYTDKPEPKGESVYSPEPNEPEPEREGE
jgi:predicted RNA-binding Zn-ribbon protein involved in translation (DUF1610 family)